MRKETENYADKEIVILGTEIMESIAKFDLY